jgi:hypothetical protein
MRGRKRRGKGGRGDYVASCNRRATVGTVVGTVDNEDALVYTLYQTSISKVVDRLFLFNISKKEGK